MTDVNEKLRNAYELSQIETVQATKNIQNWLACLDSMSRLYKYSFQDQIMIHAQNPNATACASFELWRDKMRRWVRKGSKGIALIDDSAARPRLKYIFDVSDTGFSQQRKSLTPYLWQMDEKHHVAIMDMLERRYDAEGNTVEEMLSNLADHLVQSQYERYVLQLEQSKDNSLLEELDKDSLRVAFRETLQSSITYSLFKRCGLDVDGHFELQDFKGILQFNTYDTANILGTASSNITEQVLRQIERTIKNYDKQQERGFINGENHLHTSRGLSDTGLDNTGGNKGDQHIRTDASGIPEKSHASGVQQTERERKALETSAGGGGRSNRNAGQYHTRNGEERPTTGQSDRSNGMGRPHEQPENDSNGNRTGTDHIQLGLFSTKDINTNERVEKNQNSALSTEERETDEHTSLLSYFQVGDTVYLRNEEPLVIDFIDEENNIILKRQLQKNLGDKIVTSAGFERFMQQNPLNYPLLNSRGYFISEENEIAIQEQRDKVSGLKYHYKTGDIVYLEQSKAYKIEFIGNEIRLKDTNKLGIMRSESPENFEILLSKDSLNQYLKFQAADIVHLKDDQDVYKVESRSPIQITLRTKDFPFVKQELKINELLDRIDVNPRYDYEHGDRVYLGDKESYEIKLIGVDRVTVEKEGDIEEKKLAVSVFREKLQRDVRNGHQLAFREDIFLRNDRFDIGIHSKDFENFDDYIKAVIKDVANYHQPFVIVESSESRKFDYQKDEVFTFTTFDRKIKEIEGIERTALKKLYDGGYNKTYCYILYKENPDDQELSIYELRYDIGDYAPKESGLFSHIQSSWDYEEKSNKEGSAYALTTEEIQEGKKFVEFLSQYRHGSEKNIEKNPVMNKQSNKKDTHKEKYKLLYTLMGNGITVFNTLQKKHGDYKNVAHYSHFKLSIYDEKLPNELKKEIERNFKEYQLTELEHKNGLLEAFNKNILDLLEETDNQPSDLLFSLVKQRGELIRERNKFLEKTGLPDNTNIMNDVYERLHLYSYEEDKNGKIVYSTLQESSGVYTKVAAIDNTGAIDFIKEVPENFIQQIEAKSKEIKDSLTNKADKLLKTESKGKDFNSYDDSSPNNLDIANIRYMLRTAPSQEAKEQVLYILDTYPANGSMNQKVDALIDSFWMYRVIDTEKNVFKAQYTEDGITFPYKESSSLQNQKKKSFTWRKLAETMDVLMKEKDELIRFTKLTSNMPDPEKKEFTFNKNTMQYDNSKANDLDIAKIRLILLGAKDQETKKCVDNTVQNYPADSNIKEKIDFLQENFWLSDVVETEKHIFYFYTTSEGISFNYRLAEQENKDIKSSSAAFTWEKLVDVFDQLIKEKKVQQLGSIEKSPNETPNMQDIDVLHDVFLNMKGQSLRNYVKNMLKNYTLTQDKIGFLKKEFILSDTVETKNHLYAFINMDSGIEIRYNPSENHSKEMTENKIFIDWEKLSELFESIIKEKPIQNLLTKTNNEQPSNKKRSNTGESSKGNSLKENQHIKNVDGINFVFTTVNSDQRGLEKQNTVDEQKKDTFESQSQNFKIDSTKEVETNARKQFQNNVAAIKTLQRVEAENRLATPEEQEVLSNYLGWGGLPQVFDSNDTKWATEYHELKELLPEKEYNSARRSTLNSHYTPPEVIQEIYNAIERMGFQAGNVLDPACGTGRFFGALPDSMSESKLYGIELDSISGRIAQKLYPYADIAIEGFEKTDLPDNFFDLVVGNVPFGDYSVNDPEYNNNKFLIHDYFFAKSIEKVRPGGIIALITSNGMSGGTFDKQDDRVRKYLAERCDLLGTIRLPNNVFQEAGTKIGTDIIFLQKKETKKDIDIDKLDWVESRIIHESIYEYENGEKRKNFVAQNPYFEKNPEMVLGEQSIVSGKFGPELHCIPFTKPKEMTFDQNIEKQFSQFEKQFQSFSDEQKEILKKLKLSFIKQNSYALDFLLLEHHPIKVRHGGILRIDTLFDDKLSPFLRGLKDTENTVDKSGLSIQELMNQAIKSLPANIYQDKDEEIDITEPESGQSEKKSIPADTHVRNFSYTLVDGDIYFRENSRMYKQNLGETQAERIKALIGLRDCVRKLIDCQLNGSPEHIINDYMYELNVGYDAYRKKHGLINGRGSSMAFKEDSSYYLLCSLEVLDENGNFERKADMFSKRTINQKKVVTQVGTSSEALAVSIGYRAKVDMAYMCQLTGFTEEKIVDDLKGVIFRNPKIMDIEGNHAYETADQYLSGNVRQKLRIAKKFAENYPELFESNVAALEQVQPNDLNATEIDVRIGSIWIEPEIIQQFIAEILNISDANVNFFKGTSSWFIENKSKLQVGNNVINKKFGTDDISPLTILEKTLNLKDVKIFDSVIRDGKPYRVLNEKKTILATEKQNLLQLEFGKWIFKDPERRRMLVEKYNELYNSTRQREYDGKHLQFFGLNPEIKFRDNQVNAIARQIYGGNTLLAEVVGAGKTFEMIAAAMESKRLGLCKKSMMVIPNHLIDQFASDFMLLYPSANILVATEKDFEPKNRKKFCSRIVTGDYDAVVIGHSQFEKIPISKERQEDLLTQQIDKIIFNIDKLKSEKNQQFTIKQMERMRVSLETKLEKLLKEERKDSVVTFEELGVDRLFVDEADEFKNLLLITKMNNVAGVNTNETVQKTMDMFLKCQYLNEITDGKGITFATGTPVKNTLAELFIMMMYLMPDKLTESGLDHFDAWASVFAEIKTEMELAPEGTGFRSRTRLANFYNLPELMALFKEVAQIVTDDMLNILRPKIQAETVVVQPTEIQQLLVDNLSERAEKIHKGQVNRSVDNMLSVTNDGRKTGLDQRLIDPNFPDDPNSKINVCVKDIFQDWESTKEDKLTQLVFCDLGTPQKGKKAINRTIDLYADMKKKLIAQGIPEDEIAFIHDAKTTRQKKKLFKMVNQGKVRILIGSTFKMGAGMNVRATRSQLKRLCIKSLYKKIA